MESSQNSPIVQFSFETDYQTVPKEQTVNLHVVADLRVSAKTGEKKRIPLSVVFVLDVSGSMAGEPIRHVINSVDHLVEFLDPVDQAGVVAFSDNAFEMVGLHTMDSETRRMVHKRVHEMNAGGSTNIESGLRLAASIFHAKPSESRQVILLLSDGEPNVGAQTIPALSDVAASLRPISISTLGYGPNHHEDILNAIGQSGGGKYYWIPDPSACGLQFAEAMGSQSDVAVVGLELCISPCSHVEIVKVLGNLRTRIGQDGLIVSLSDLRNGARRLVAVEATFNSGEVCEKREIMKGTIRYKQAGSDSTIQEQQSASLKVANEAILTESSYHKTLLVRCEDARSQARSFADHGQFDAAASVLKKMLDIIKKAPGFVAGNNSPLAEVHELLLDEIMAMEQKPKEEEYREFRRSQLSTTSDSEDLYQSPSQSRGLSGQEWVEGMAGQFPKAFLEIIGGNQDGTQIPLKAQQRIGRTSSADIFLSDARISRCHAQIFAKEGAFFIVDCGSSNVTMVNGIPIKTHRLVSGDIIQLGNTRMCYKILETKESSDK